MVGAVQQAGDGSSLIVAEPEARSHVAAPPRELSSAQLHPCSPGQRAQVHTVSTGVNSPQGKRVGSCAVDPHALGSVGADVQRAYERFQDATALESPRLTCAGAGHARVARVGTYSRTLIARPLQEALLLERSAASSSASNHIGVCSVGRCPSVMPGVRNSSGYPCAS